MTHSWPSQQPPGTGGSERFLYSDSKERKRHSSQHKHVRNDAPLRSSVAPHKSMLADDLKLSSDEDDDNKGPQQNASWAGNHRLSGQHTHTHGGRARHSSSGSSGSDSSSESESNSQRSCSHSPGPQIQPETHNQLQPLTYNRVEQDPSLKHWQLNKWLEKACKNQQSVVQNPEGSLSSDSDRGPSPGGYWERDSGFGTRHSYSPSQSPVPSPKFDYSPRHSQRSSPGYSPCPSPGISPVPSPVPSVCPSPGASLGVSRSPSPLPPHPPKSPSPSPSPNLTYAPAFPRLAAYVEASKLHQKSSGLSTQPTFTPSPECQSRVKPWVPSGYSTECINDCTSKVYRPPSQSQHHSKHSLTHKETPHKSQSYSKPNLSPKTKAKHLSYSETHTEHSRRPSDPKSKFNQSFNSRPKYSPPPKSKDLTHTGSSNHLIHSSGSKPLTQLGAEISGRSFSKPSYRLNSSPKPKTSSREAVAPNPRPAQREQKLREREQDVHSRGEAQGGALVQTPEAQRQGRLAEEQLRRHRWVRSFEKEEEEEEERRKEQGEQEEKRRRRNAEWQAIQPKQRPHTNSQHQPQTECSGPEREEKRRKKRRRSSEDHSSHPVVIDSNPSPPLSPPSPTPVVPPTHQPSSSSSSSSSSVSSSESDSEPSPPPNIAKVPADSTSSQRPATKRRHEDQCRPTGLRSNVVSPQEGEQHRGKHKLYTLVPFGRTEQSTAVSHRGLRNLVVKIDLSLLNRVPSTSEASQGRSSFSSSTLPSAKTKENSSMKHQYHQEQESGESTSKRKLENGEGKKKSKRSLFQTDKVLASKHSAESVNQESRSNSRQNGHHADYIYNKKPLSPLSPSSSAKLQRSDQRYSHPPKDRDCAVKKTQMQKPRPKIEEECAGVSGNTLPRLSSWAPSANQPSYYRETVPYTDVSHHAEYYMHEAKRLKHRADAMVDKLGKAVNYVDAALSFMECGKAMEKGPLEAKSPYTMYAETVELIRYAMRLKSHTSPGARQEDKQLAVLCFRCLALLYWQMFRLKKDHALKYSKALMDYFKSSPKVPPPSWNDATKGNVPPTCISPVGIPGSQSGNSPIASFINIPQRIHQMAANHLNITNSVLYSYEYWEVADSLAKENKEFFNYLNTLTAPLTLHSSMAHIVQYTRQGLQWIRISANLS